MKNNLLIAAAGSFLMAAAGLSWGVPGEVLMEYSAAEISLMLVGMTVMFFMTAFGVMVGVRLICGIAEYIADCADARLMRREERYVDRAVICRAGRSER